jgi:hypothetical protein
MMAYCTACNAPRMPLATTSVNLAGRPSQVTGTVARVFGWMVLASGLTFALILLAIFQAIVPGGFIGWAFFVPIALVSTICGVALLRGGKNLVAEGKGTERQTKSQAILALAQHRGGKINAWDVAGALSISLQQADSLLTELAKASPDTVAVDIDEASGTLVYRIDASGAAVRMRIFDEKVRIAAAQAEAEAQAQPDYLRQSSSH